MGIIEAHADQLVADRALSSVEHVAKATMEPRLMQTWMAAMLAW